jgi:hypothetical protein
MSKRQQGVVLAILFVGFLVSLVYSLPVWSSLFRSESHTTHAAVQRLPVVDEDQASAAQPLSTVLDLDFMHDGNDGNSYTKFDQSVRSRLRHHQFQDLDAFASDLRKTKSRIPGGGWRLYRFYSQLTEPAAGTNVSDGEWQTHLKLLLDWIEAYPQSITARVAYGNTLVNYAWRARGDGLGSEVTNRQWTLFDERLAQAEKVLTEAYDLPTRCPQWYAAMQTVALGQSWKRSKYDELFEEAIRFEPLYLNYYTQKAYYLLPRWYGEDGDSERFAAQAADEIGGAEGGALYYFVFTYLTTFYKQDRVLESKVIASWPRLKQGFADTDRLYKVAFSVVNLYAKMAYIAGDKSETRAAIERIGTNWHKSVWGSQENFDRAKSWAMVPPPNTSQKIGIISRP